MGDDARGVECMPSFPEDYTEGSAVRVFGMDGVDGFGVLVEWVSKSGFDFGNTGFAWVAEGLDVDFGVSPDRECWLGAFG